MYRNFYNLVPRRNKHSLEKIQHLISVGNVNELKKEILVIARDMNLSEQYKSLNILIPKICIKYDNHDITKNCIDMLELVQEDLNKEEQVQVPEIKKEGSNDNSFFIIGLLQLMSECLDVCLIHHPNSMINTNSPNIQISSKSNELASSSQFVVAFQDAWKAYKRLKNMNHHLSYSVYEKFLRVCALHNFTDEMLIIMKDYPTVVEPTLILALEPLLISGRVVEYYDLLKRYLDARTYEINMSHMKPSNETILFNLKRKIKGNTSSSSEIVKDESVSSNIDKEFDSHSTVNVLSRVLQLMYITQLKRMMSYTNMSSNELVGYKNTIDRFKEFFKLMTEHDPTISNQHTFIVPRIFLYQIESCYDIHRDAKTQINTQFLSKVPHQFELTGFDYILEDRHFFRSPMPLRVVTTTAATTTTSNVLNSSSPLIQDNHSTVALSNTSSYTNNIYQSDPMNGVNNVDDVSNHVKEISRNLPQTIVNTSDRFDTNSTALQMKSNEIATKPFNDTIMFDESTFDPSLTNKTNMSYNASSNSSTRYKKSNLLSIKDLIVNDLTSQTSSRSSPSASHLYYANIFPEWYDGIYKLGIPNSSFTYAQEYYGPDKVPSTPYRYATNTYANKINDEEDDDEEEVDDDDDDDDENDNTSAESPHDLIDEMRSKYGLEDDDDHEEEGDDDDDDTGMNLSDDYFQNVANDLKKEVARQLNIDPTDIITYTIDHRKDPISRINSSLSSKTNSSSRLNNNSRVSIKSLGAYVYGNGHLNVPVLLQNSESNLSKQSSIEDMNTSDVNNESDKKMQNIIQDSSTSTTKTDNVNSRFLTIFDLTTYFRSRNPPVEISYTSDIFETARQGFDDHDDDDEDNYWDEDDDDEEEDDDDDDMSMSNNEHDDIDDGKDQGNGGGMRSTLTIITPRPVDDNTTGKTSGSGDENKSDK